MVSRAARRCPPRRIVVPESEARLAYVTSFTGSAGIAVIGSKRQACSSICATRRRRLSRPTRSSSPSLRPLGVSMHVSAISSQGWSFRSVATTLAAARPVRKARRKLGNARPHRQSCRPHHPDRPAPLNAPAEFLGQPRRYDGSKSLPTPPKDDHAAEGVDAVVLTPARIDQLVCSTCAAR